jgi:hypothetical protein
MHKAAGKIIVYIGVCIQVGNDVIPLSFLKFKGHI